MTECGDRVPQVREETRALRRLQSALAEAEVALAKRMRMNPTDLAALEHLSFAPAPIGPGELSARLGITPAAGTELVDRLKRAGHVDRTRDEVDRRRVRLHLSADAAEQVLGELQSLFVALDAVGDAYSAGEREVILRYLTDVIAAYGSFATGDDPP